MAEVIKQSEAINPAYRLLIKQVMTMVTRKIEALPDDKIDQAVNAFSIVGNGIANDSVTAEDIIKELADIFADN